MWIILFVRATRFYLRSPGRTRKTRASWGGAPEDGEGEGVVGRRIEWRSAFGKLWDALGQTLYPPRCLACGAVGPLVVAGALKGLACPACAGAFRPVDSPLCSRCGAMFPSREGDDHVCGDCLERPRRFGRARAAGVYDQSLMSVILSLKYRGKTRAAEPLGRLLFETFSRHWSDGNIDAIVPVPLHPRRLRRRGFNQAYLLVRNWPKLAREKTAAPSPWRIEGAALVRRRSTASQTGLDRRARAGNVRGAFAVARPEAVAGRRVLLVDDVMTTGATVEACARALRTAGAERVDVLTLARANR